MATSVRSRVHGGFVSACVALGVVSTAWGDPIWVQVTGIVTDSSFSTIPAESLFTGLYAYDDALAPYVDLSGIALYQPVAVSVVFADGSSLSTNEGWIRLHDDYVVSDTETRDAYTVGFDNIPVGSGTQTGAFAPYSAHGWMVALRDPTGAAWDSLVPLPDPEIVERLPIDNSLLAFDYAGGGTENFLHLHITDLTVVPLPGAVVLGGIGLGCCRRLLRRRSM